MVLRLGQNWQASTSLSHTVHQQDDMVLSDFTPTHIQDQEGCSHEESCYELMLSRKSGAGNDGSMSIGAVHRRFGDTLRLYFNDDFFNQLESLYLVRGDSLPELKFSLTRRLSRSILTRLESNLASGGGGILLAEDANSYENAVRYLVTSLDTRFENTSTGVFFAFHHLEQELDPLDSLSQVAHQMELDRLQLVLTQDLNVLHRLASDLALHLNMELSRGAAPGSSVYDEEELRKRVTGGVAVRF